MCKRNHPYTLEETHLVRHQQLSLETITRSFAGRKFDQVMMCGNNGEPFANKEVYEILKFFSPSTKCLIANTNGSLRTTKFWSELAKLPNLEVVWGIDGITQQTHELYRVNTDLQKIFANARAFIESGGKAIWQMIIFKHNEHELARAKQISTEMGFAEFRVVHTKRFYVDEIHKYEWKGEVRVLEKSQLTQVQPLSFFKDKAFTITCQGETTEEIYIEATGEVWPCCYIPRDNTIPRISSEYNINNRPIHDIINSAYFDEVKQSFTTSPMSMCTRTCGHNHRNLRIPT